ncbi:MAG: hypothetical protein RL141_647 [Candidatus Parcubacteria bacterium]|jgi:SAM-dependent methyltransferase
MTLTDALPALHCTACHGPLLRAEETALVCTACGVRYPVKNGAGVFGELLTPPEQIGDPFVQRIKKVLKRYERLYYILVPITGALFVGRMKGLDVLRHVPAGGLVLNLGSGPKQLSPAVMNIDAEPFAGVAVAAQAHALPFRDASVDGVICECLLEHVTDPIAVVKEVERVLKPGGAFYLTVPFVDPYHSAPDDYYRWTTSGIRQLTSAFQEQELAMGWGPTSSMISAYAHWMGVLLSFGSRTLYQIITLGFQTVLCPLRPLDYLFRRYPYATNSSLGYYYFGKKK